MSRRELSRPIFWCVRCEISTSVNRLYLCARVRMRAWACVRVLVVPVRVYNVVDLLGK